MNSYSSYKKSNIKWFGKIPEDWKMTPIKYLFSERNERNDEGNINYLSIVKDKGVIPYSEKGNVGNKTSDKPENYKMVHVNDIVINPMNITIGSVGISNYQGCLSSVYVVLNPNGSINSSYYDYIFSDKSFQKSLKRISNGIMEIRESIKKIEFYCEKLPVPSKTEQTQIVSFLDTKTKKIDELIEKTEQKIKLLKEKRTSLINHCVTRGLNPDVEMKDSGVEWIGEIPSHWNKSKFKYFSNVVRGSILRPVDEPSYFDKNGYWTYLNISDVSKVEKYLDKGKLRLSDIGSNKSRRVEPNNLIITGSGTVGKVFINKIPVCVHDGFIPLLDLKINIDFTFYYLINPNLYVGIGKTNSQKNIYLDEVKNMDLCVPPKEEQQQIVDYLDTKIQKIVSTIEKETQRIELLKEYRQSLISEVVTGKIDVRDWNK